MPARNALMVAASVGDVEQIAALLASDSSSMVAVQDARGWNALVYAAVGGKIEAVKVKTHSARHRLLPPFVSF